MSRIKTGIETDHHKCYNWIVEDYNMEKKLKKYNELTADELYDIMKLRVDVFVVEQNCPYHELDGLDKIAYHLWLEDFWRHSRLSEDTARRERRLGSGAWKGHFGEKARGVGSVLLNEGIEAVRELYGALPITIEAQVYAKQFYEKDGFVQVSEPFDEDGIPHIRMQRKPKSIHS